MHDAEVQAMILKSKGLFGRARLRLRGLLTRVLYGVSRRVFNHCLRYSQDLNGLLRRVDRVEARQCDHEAIARRLAVIEDRLEALARQADAAGAGRPASLPYLSKGA
jgi:hypothetical protein